MYSALPFFKSHYSLGKSILTLAKAGASEPDEPSSIIDVAKKLELNSIYLIEDSLSGFLEGYKSCEESKLTLRFGLRLTICDDINNKSNESREREHKVIVFLKNSDGYSSLVKISSVACSDGFYYYPRIDFKTLKTLWNENSLTLGIPFYDSFIFKNNLTYSICIPDFSFCKPIFFLEDNNLPFDFIIKKRVQEFAGDKNEIVQAQSIYYENKEDFLPYLTFRCISQRTTLNKPELDHCSSNEFCAQSFKEKYGK
jgi:DNA polymerase III alpha subunit